MARVYASMVLTALVLAVMVGCGSPKPVEKPPDSTPVPTREQQPESVGGNLLTNGGMEQATAKDPTLPAGWKRVKATKASAVLVAEGEGKVVKVTSDPTGKLWPALGQVVREVAPGRYRVALKAKGAGGARVLIADRTPNVQDPRLGSESFVGPDWAAREFRFVVPEGSSSIEVLLTVGKKADPKATAWFDDVALARAE